MVESEPRFGAYMNWEGSGFELVEVRLSVVSRDCCGVGSP